MPAFGLLGIDFGHGFDALPGQAMDGNPLYHWATTQKNWCMIF
jgi:outer membrane protein insertion porin family